MRYFISHESLAIDTAIKFKNLLCSLNNEHQVFLTSDWNSLQAGGIWLQEIFHELQTFDEIIILITRKEALENLWINFEIGAAIGRNKKPKILIWGGINMSEMNYPIKGIHCISTGDTNRLIEELKTLGYEIKNHIPFAELFNQINS